MVAGRHWPSHNLMIGSCSTRSAGSDPPDLITSIKGFAMRAPMRKRMKFTGAFLSSPVGAKVLYQSAQLNAARAPGWTAATTVRRPRPSGMRNAMYFGRPATVVPRPLCEPPVGREQYAGPTPADRRRGDDAGRQGDRARDHRGRLAHDSNSPYRTASSDAVTNIRFWAAVIEVCLWPPICLASSVGNVRQPAKRTGRYDCRRHAASFSTCRSATGREPSCGCQEAGCRPN